MSKSLDRRLITDGHIEHWQRQDNAETARPVASLNLELERKDEEIRALKDRLERTALTLGDTALTVVRNEEELRQANRSLGALSATLSTLCELHIACKFDDFRAEIDRLATNYSQIKAAVTARKLH